MAPWDLVQCGPDKGVAAASMALAREKAVEMKDTPSQYRAQANLSGRLGPRARAALVEAMTVPRIVPASSLVPSSRILAQT
jgi:hypothetical protein